VRFGTVSQNSCVANVPLDFATNGNAQFSLEAWVNGGPQTTDAGIITKGTGAGGEQFNLDCGSPGLSILLYRKRCQRPPSRVSEMRVLL